MVEDYPELFTMGSKVVDAGVNLENHLVELLKVQVKTLKSLTAQGKNLDLTSVDKVNSFNKTIILALMLADDQIKRGIEICENSQSIKKV